MNSFQITTLVQAIFPWIVVTMENCVLSEKERDFMIAGLVAVFLLVENPFPSKFPNLLCRRVTVLAFNFLHKLKGALQPFCVPDHKVLDYLFTTYLP